LSKLGLQNRKIHVSDFQTVLSTLRDSFGFVFVREDVER
jgi:hypothetical protein